MSEENPPESNDHIAPDISDDDTIPFVGNLFEEAADSIKGKGKTTKGWDPPTPEEIDPQFTDHSVEKLLGRGGMGAVYLANQLSLDRKVAIKLLPPEMDELDPTFAVRFEREAKSMAKLDHPNIVTVFDYGRTEKGYFYFVMEYVEGMDFHQLIRSNELDAAGALQAISQVCKALEHAHGRGFVHRDIKPANILINRDGVIKVGDFGLAKLIDGDDDSEENDTAVTMTGCGIGTPDYCAPEQIEGRQVDHRADIYSLGVMLYEMLTHELPRGNFQLPSKKVSIDVRLDKVVLKAMESSPELRYSSAQDMRTDVEVVRSDSEGGLSKKEVSKPSRKRGIFAIIWKVCGILSTVIVLGMAGLIGYFFYFEYEKKQDKASPFPLSPETGHGGSHRLVVIDSDRSPGKEYPNWIKKLSREDPESIQEFQLFAGEAGSGFPAIAWVNEGGSIESLGVDESSEGKEITRRDTNLEGRFFPGNNSDWFALDTKQKLHYLGTNKSFSPPASLAGVVDIELDGNVIRALQADGSLVSWGDEASYSDSEVNLVKWSASLSEITNLTSVGVIRNRKEFLQMPNLKLAPNSGVEVRKVLSGNSGFVEMSDGTLQGLREFPVLNWLHNSPYVETLKGVHRNMGPDSSALALHFSNRDWRVFTDEADENSELEQVSEVLQGAISAKVWGSVIFALFPAEAIPRSGLWTAEDLFNARRNHTTDPFSEFQFGPVAPPELSAADLKREFEGVLLETRIYRSDFQEFQSLNLSSGTSSINESNSKKLLAFIQRPDVELLESNQIFVRAGSYRAKADSVSELVYRLDGSKFGAESRNVGTTLEKGDGKGNGETYPFDLFMERVGYDMTGGDGLNVTELGFLTRVPTFKTFRFSATMNPQQGRFVLVSSNRLAQPLQTKIDLVVARVANRSVSNREATPENGFPDIPPDQQPFQDTKASDDADSFDKRTDPIRDSSDTSGELPVVSTGFLVEARTYRIERKKFREFLSNPSFAGAGLEKDSVLKEFITLPEVKVIELVSSPIPLNRRIRAESVSEVLYYIGKDSDTGEDQYETRNIGATLELDALVESNAFMNVYMTYERVTFDPWEGSNYDTPLGGLSMMPCFYTDKITTALLISPNDEIFLGTMQPGPPAHKMIDILVLQVRQE